MPSSVTTLTGLTTKSGTSPRGPWVLTVFTAADGGEFSTFDGNLASKASTLLNQPVTVEWEPYEKDGRQRRTLTGVEKAADEVAQITPHNTATLQPVAQTNNGYRTKEQIMRTDALNATLSLFGIIGLDPLSSVEEFEGWVATFYGYIVTGALQTPRIGVEA